MPDIPTSLGDLDGPPGVSRGRHARAGQPAAAPRGRARPLAPSARFFDPREGLLAASLTSEIEELGAVAAGNGGQLYHYSDGVWQADGERVVRERAAELLVEQYRMSYASTAVDILSNREPVLSDADLDERYLNLPNGLLDWRTLQLTRHDPAVRSVTRIPIRWDPHAECPAITKWLDEVLPPNSLSFAEELAGYMLYNGNPLHKAVILFGRGRNGKGTFLRLLGRLAGEENCCSVSPQSLDDNRFMSAELYGKTANLVGDVDPRTFKATEIFKMVTGGDHIPAERKHGQPFRFKARALMIAGFNALPRTSDTSTGFFSRWIVIPFTRYYPAEVADLGLDARLSDPAEMRGLLVLAARGLRRVMERGHFDLPEAVIKATTQFRYSADPVRAWMTECTVAAHDEFVPRSQLYGAFNAWCEANGHREMGSGTFYERLASASEDLFGYPLAPKQRTGIRGFKGIRFRVPTDLAASPDDDDDPDDSTGANQHNRRASGAKKEQEEQKEQAPYFARVPAYKKEVGGAPSAPPAPFGGCPDCGSPDDSMFHESACPGRSPS